MKTETCKTLKAVKYPVDRLVAGHPLRDGRSRCSLIQVGAVVVHKELVSQSVQLCGHKWVKTTKSSDVFLSKVNYAQRIIPIIEVFH